MDNKTVIKFGGGSSSGFGVLLTILFVTLKLTGTISWPWLWVLCPLWIGLAFALAVLVSILVFTLIVVIVALIIAGIAALLQ